MKSVRDLCSENQLALALYRLGYTLHAIQDLAAHKGRSAAEHSWNESCRESTCGKTIPEIDDERNPDEFEPNIEFARIFTRRFLDLVANHLASCWDEMRWYGGRGISILDKRSEPLKLSWDLTPAALLAYRSSAKAFGEAGPARARTIRWFRNADDANRLFVAIAGRIDKVLH